MHDVSRLRRALFDLRRLHLDVTRSEAWVLTGISRRQGGISQTELARVLGLGKVATGEFVSDLERKGFVVRRPDSSDRRALSVQLTSTGRRMLAKISAVVAKMNAEIFVGYSSSELQQLADHLSQTKRRLIQLIDLDDSTMHRKRKGPVAAARVAVAQRSEHRKPHTADARLRQARRLVRSTR